MLEKELETAIATARAAGAVILDYYEKGFEIEEKILDDNFSEPVTIADRSASRVIVESLIEEFPNDGVLSEEEFDDKSRLDKKRVWIIDPLDGTQGFINRNGDFAVQIGLADAGEAVLGVIYLPLEDVLYFAVKGAGALMIKAGSPAQALQVSDKIDFSTMNLAVSRNHRSPKMNEVFNMFGLKSETRRGSVGLKIGLIARQICDLYIHLSPRTKHWDTCAPEIVLREAGGDLTDLFGERILYNTADFQNHNGVLATNGATHEKAVKSLKPLLAQFDRLRVKSVRGK